MLQQFQQALCAFALGAMLTSSSSLQSVNAEELCSLVPGSYAAAKATYPETAFALSELEKHSIATWYSDRNGDYSATLSQLVAKCSESSRLSLVVYGIPNKDCETGYSSSGGTVKDSTDYLAFLNTLTSTVGDRKALYVLEPDAVGLLAKEGGCGEAAGYRDNLKTAIKELSGNPNAEIYLDIGYWMLQWPDNLSRVALVFKELATAGTIKGVTINTSNYRSNAELSTLCSNFQEAVGSTAYHCIVDTSRNYNEPSSTEWCNVRSAGIGHPPTSETGYSNLDYFMWIKPPGESDGACSDGSHTSEAMQGPAAGLFFKDSLKLLWNQGYFVKEMGMPEIDGSILPTPAPTTTTPETPTPAPTTVTPGTPTPDSTSPVQQDPTPAPTSVTPVTPIPVDPTPAPTTLAPITITPEGSTPAPTTSAPVTLSPDVPTLAPITSSPVIVDTPTTKPTPFPTPCSYPLAGGDANHPTTPSPTLPTPAPTGSTPVATPASTHTADASSDADSDADSNDIEIPTPAPTSLRGGEVGSDAIGLDTGSKNNDDVKQVSTESDSSGVGATAGILAVFVVIGAVAAIAAYMNSQAKKKLLEEPKDSPLHSAVESQASYLSAL